MKFDDLNLFPGLLNGIREAGFTECMPVQEETLPDSLKGKDVFVQSQTGSGKTAAFLITLFQRLKEQAESDKIMRALVIVPTRELAVQIEEEAKLIGKHQDLRSGSFYGGVGYAHQEKMLQQGVEIVVGTPGRLIDFIEKKKLKLDNFGILVLDEADRMFDMGFMPDIRRIIGSMNKKTERQTMLFSATLSYRVRELAWKYMHNPVEVDIEPEQTTVNTVDHFLYHVGAHEKMNVLLGLLKKENPDTAIIFTNTKGGAYRLAKRMELNGYKAEFIMGDLPQKKRLQLIDRMKNGDIRFLVATDVASRGLHVDDLSMVINFDVPQDPENYIHRIGRTARAGKHGMAITLACEDTVLNLSAVERTLGQKVPVKHPEPDLFAEDKSKGINIYLPKVLGGRQARSGNSSSGRGPVRRRPAGRSHSMEVRPEKDSRQKKSPPRKKKPLPVKNPVSSSERKPDLAKKTKQDSASVRNTSNRKTTQSVASSPNKSPASKKTPVHKNKYENAQKKNHSPRQRNTVKPGKYTPRKSMREMTDSERLAYYKEKYGENFQPKKKGLLHRIFGNKKK